MDVTVKLRRKKDDVKDLKVRVWSSFGAKGKASLIPN